MRISNLEIIVHRGETFTLDFDLQNADGSPFVIPKYDRPTYFLFEVCSTVFRNNENEIYRFWQDVDELGIPTFVYTNIIDVQMLKDGENTAVTWYKGVPCFESTTSGTYYEVEGYLYRKANGEYVYCIAPSADESGTFSSCSNSYNGTKLSFAFTGDITRRWGAQSYKYNLKLVSGTVNPDYPTDSNIVMHDDDMDTKQIIIAPNKFTVLYDINNIGGK